MIENVNLSLWVWVSSLRMIDFHFFHLPENLQFTFFLQSWKITLCKHATFLLSIHQLMDFEIVSIFQLSWNKQQWTWISKFFFAEFWRIPKMDPISSFLRNFHVDFHSGCTRFHFYQQWRNVLLSPQPHQHLLRLEWLQEQTSLG